MGEETKVDFQERSDIVLEQAKITAETVSSWMEFSNIMFDQRNGLVQKSFPDPEERKRFFFTEQSKQIDDINLGLMKKFGLAARKVAENETHDLVFVNCIVDGV